MVPVGTNHLAQAPTPLHKEHGKYCSVTVCEEVDESVDIFFCIISLSLCILY
jgi:hypothetical protein